MCSCWCCKSNWIHFQAVFIIFSMWFGIVLPSNFFDSMELLLWVCVCCFVFVVWESDEFSIEIDLSMTVWSGLAFENERLKFQWQKCDQIPVENCVRFSCESRTTCWFLKMLRHSTIQMSGNVHSNVSNALRVFFKCSRPCFHNIAHSCSNTKSTAAARVFISFSLSLFLHAHRTGTRRFSNSHQNRSAKRFILTNFIQNKHMNYYCFRYSQ